jgi:hypothetical protein
VRIGNSAASRPQLHTYRELFDSIYLVEREAFAGRIKLISYDD